MFCEVARDFSSWISDNHPFVVVHLQRYTPKKVNWTKFVGWDDSKNNHQLILSTVWLCGATLSIVLMATERKFCANYSLKWCEPPHTRLCPFLLANQDYLSPPTAGAESGQLELALIGA